MSGWANFAGALQVAGAGASGYAKGKRQYDDAEAEREEREQRKKKSDLEIAKLEEDARTRQMQADLADDAVHGEPNYEGLAQGTNLTGTQIKRGVGIGVLDLNSVPRAKMSEAAIARRGGAIALRRNDMAGYREGLAFARNLESDDAFNAGVQAYMKDPQGVGQRLSTVNTTSKFITSAPHEQNGRKTGYQAVSIVRGDGTAKFTQYSPQQMARLAGAEALMPTNPAKALEIIGSVDKDLAEAVARENAMTVQSITSNNQATHNANQDATSRERLSMERQNSQLPRLGGQITTIGPDGQPSIQQVVAHRDGRVEGMPLSLPPGHKLPRQVSPEAIERRGAALEGTEDPERPGHRMTRSRALVVAERQLHFGGDGSGLPPLPPPPGARPGGGRPQPAPAPQAGLRPPLSISTPRAELQAETSRGNERARQLLLQQIEREKGAQGWLPR